MINRLHTLDSGQIQILHESCMDILSNVGIRFCDAEAIDIFKQHGFKVDKETVFFTEEQVLKALETVPSEFTIHARNPEKSVTMGGDHFGLGPGWGAPFIVDADGTKRTATITDQENFCKLVQTSPHLDFAAGSMAVPAELSPTAATSAMLGAAFTLTDMPVISNPCCRENADEIVEMATIAYGGADALKKGPITIVSVNPLSPLTYTEEAAGGLINYARHGQALLISSMILAGISGPIDLAGTAVLEMSESLAGIVLAQLVNPGTPCVCGGTSCASDMRTGGVYLGGPEQLKLMAVATQMAEHYGLPCRYGGNLTDAWSINYQAGVESALALSNTLISGGHFIHQSCGILGAYNAISFEKFILDEEICGLVKRSLKPLVINGETLALDLIKKTGHGGNYMVLMETAMKCRTAFYPAQLAKRGTHESWDAQSMGNNVKAATDLVAQRLDAYVKPDNDPQMEKDIEKYVAAKAQNG